jgi:hypothetical protein
MLSLSIIRICTIYLKVIDMISETTEDIFKIDVPAVVIH